MPKNKLQGIVFGLLMSYSMAIGMEVYNIAVKMGFSLNAGGLSTMTNAVFPAALREASGHLGGDHPQKFTHGVFLEYVCRGTVLPLDFPQNISGEAEVLGKTVERGMIVVPREISDMFFTSFPSAAPGCAPA